MPSAHTLLALHKGASTPSWQTGFPLVSTPLHASPWLGESLGDFERPR